MKTIHPQICVVLALCALTAAGCESSKSRNPLSPTVAGPIEGVTITAPKPLEPANGQTLTAGGSLSLLIENAATTGERPIWLQLELASDAGFQNKIHVADKMAPGSDGRTTYQLPVTLPAAGARYFWRARALDGANTGEFSATASFVLQDPVQLGVPTLASPAVNAAVDSLTPDLTVVNGVASGPLAGPVSYRFDIALDSGFGQMVAVLTVPRSGGATTTARPTALSYNTTYFWRVSGSDGVTSSSLAGPFAFRTPAAPVAPPPPPAAPAPAPTTPAAPAPPATPTTPVAPRPTGARAANPAPGQRLPLPNMSSVVDDVARQYPGALRNSCQSHGGSWEFMDRLVDRLRTYDTRWGYNGKRGNAGDPSHDVVAYNFGADRDEGTTNVYIIDVIVGHCGSNPGPAFIDQTGVTAQQGSIGRWTSRGRF